MSELRPMDVGEILDGAFTMYQRHFGLLAQLGIAALWLPVALTTYIRLSGGEQSHLLLTLVTVVCQYFAGLVLTAGAIRVISDSYLGRAPRLGDALRLGTGKIWPLFLVGLGKGLVLGLCVAVVGVATAILVPALASAKVAAALTAVGLVAFGIWLVVVVACGYAVTTQVVVLEDLGSAFDAFTRSWELTKGSRRKIFSTALVAFFIFVLPTGVMSGVRDLVAARYPVVGQIAAVLAALLPIIMTPLLACVFTLMYYDLRVRREAFDLQVLGQQLGIV